MIQNVAHTIAITVVSLGAMEATPVVSRDRFLCSEVQHEDTGVVQVHNGQGMECDVGKDRQVLKEGKPCVH